MEITTLYYTRRTLQEQVDFFSFSKFHLFFPKTWEYYIQNDSFLPEGQRVLIDTIGVKCYNKYIHPISLRHSERSFFYGSGNLLEHPENVPHR